MGARPRAPFLPHVRRTYYPLGLKAVRIAGAADAEDSLYRRHDGCLLCEW